METKREYAVIIRAALQAPLSSSKTPAKRFSFAALAPHPLTSIDFRNQSSFLPHSGKLVASWDSVSKSLAALPSSSPHLHLRLSFFSFSRFSSFNKFLVVPFHRFSFFDAMFRFSRYTFRTYPLSAKKKDVAQKM